jgi:hypothetical protein
VVDKKCANKGPRRGEDAGGSGEVGCLYERQSFHLRWRIDARWDAQPLTLCSVSPPVLLGHDQHRAQRQVSQHRNPSHHNRLRSRSHRGLPVASSRPVLASRPHVMIDVRDAEWLGRSAGYQNRRPFEPRLRFPTSFPTGNVRYPSPCCGRTIRAGSPGTPIFWWGFAAGNACEVP